MSYVLFLLKKVYRNLFQSIPFIFIAIFIIILYIGNHTSAYHDMSDPAFSGEQESIQVQKDVVQFQEQMKKLPKSSKEYQDASANLKTAQTRLTSLHEKLYGFKNKNWRQYYNGDLELSKLALFVTNANNSGSDKDIIESLTFNKEFASYMKIHHLSFDDRFTPVQGISYLSQILREQMPFILVILLAFITSTIYCKSFFDNLDIHSLLPMRRLKKQSYKLFSSVVVGIVIILFVSAISILCGTVGNVIGSFESPVLLYTLQGMKEYIPFLSLFPQYLLLFILSVIFITNFVAVISIFIRRNITSFFIAILILMGCMWMTTNIVPLYSLTHILPFTYLNAWKVTSGELMFTTGNSHVLFLNGVIVLSAFSIILFLIYSLIMKYRSKGVHADV